RVHRHAPASCRREIIVRQEPSAVLLPARAGPAAFRLQGHKLCALHPDPGDEPLPCRVRLLCSHRDHVHRVGKWPGPHLGRENFLYLGYPGRVIVSFWTTANEWITG